MASAWFGGTGPGLFSVLISTLVVDYFFVPPFHFASHPHICRSLFRRLRRLRSGGQLGEFFKKKSEWPSSTASIDWKSACPSALRSS